MISVKGVSADPKKLEVMVAWPIPKEMRTKKVARILRSYIWVVLQGNELFQEEVGAI